LYRMFSVLFGAHIFSNFLIDYFSITDWLYLLYQVCYKYKIFFGLSKYWLVMLLIKISERG
jgi:hypothetical protein